MKILLILVGDTELCPGPRANGAGCFKVVRRNQGSKVCEICGELYHVECLRDRREGNIEKFYCSICSVHTEHETGSEHRVNVPLYLQLNSYLKNRGLKILHLNLNGLLAKIDQIRLLLTETGCNNHILQISESHLDDSIPDSLIDFYGYNIIRKDRKGGPGVGVCIYMRNDMNYQRRLDFEKDEIEALVIELFI